MNRLTKKDYIDWEYRTGYYNKEYVKRLNEKTLKLGRLEDIEEELGCPLEVVFRALEEGIVDNESHEHRHVHLRDNGTSEHPKGWIFHTFHFSYVFKLSDYQKTWWLKGEKENA